MGNFNLREINEQAIKQWKITSTENIKTKKLFKEKNLGPKKQRPPQVRDKRPRGKRVTEIIFSKKKNRYVERIKEQPSAKWGYAQGVNEEHEISKEKLKSIRTMDKIQESLRRSKYHGVNTTCRCGCRDEEITLKELGIE